MAPPLTEHAHTYTLGAAQLIIIFYQMDIFMAIMQLSVHLTKDNNYRLIIYPRMRQLESETEWDIHCIRMQRWRTRHLLTHYHFDAFKLARTRRRGNKR